MSGKAINYQSIRANVTLGLKAAVKAEAARQGIPMNVFLVRSIRASLPQPKRKYVRKEPSTGEA
jgi:hypothetical protein